MCALSEEVIRYESMHCSRANFVTSYLRWTREDVVTILCALDMVYFAEFNSFTTITTHPYLM